MNNKVKLFKWKPDAGLPLSYYWLIICYSFRGTICLKIIHYIVPTVIKHAPIFSAKAKLQFNFIRVNMSHLQFCENRIWNVPISLSKLNLGILRRKAVERMIMNNKKDV